MSHCKTHMQKCVRSVGKEKPRWGYELSPYLSIFIKLGWSEPRTEFDYYPTFAEIREVIKRMKEVYGEDKVKQELNL